MIRRDSTQEGFLGKFRPIFKLAYLKNPHSTLINAKMISNNALSTIVVSKNSEEFTENCDAYVGKIKANFTGSVFNIYGPGYNPTDAK